MTTSVDDVAGRDSAALGCEAIDFEQVLLASVPEFIGALSAALVSAVAVWAIHKWRLRGRPEGPNEDMSN
ncbi:hypothetical protein [Streptomyces sp. 2R]|uniref:hypothetical protein n=1 Tax=Streptomyces sp. 2R TaxID=1883452 RepID=UPI0011815BF1|nr:hypothetical protein [Streptomyces sp. 2R]